MPAVDLLLSSLIAAVGGDDKGGVQPDNLILWLTAATGLIGAVWALVRDRRKPTLDAASTDQIKAQVKKSAEEYGARRDLQFLRLENWAFQEVRPWGRAMVVRDELMMDMLVKAYEKLELPLPEIPPLLPMPEMPPPIAADARAD